MGRNRNRNSIRLVNMPFGSLARPSLALSQFKAQLLEAGLEASVENASFDLATRIGCDRYETIAPSPCAEWIFASEAWGGDFGPDDDEFFTLPGVLDRKKYPPSSEVAARRAPSLGPGVDTDELKRIRREVVGPYLDALIEKLLEGGEPAVVLFTCTFFQTAASLALARRLRARSPSTRIGFGGACFHAGMGLELLKKAEAIDAVSVGEADDVIVPLVRALLEGRDPEGLQGIAYRRRTDGAVVPGLPTRPATSEVLEALPDPTFDDYFSDRARIRLEGEPYIPFESSRGCWWGQVQHCTFCGLNAEGMSYRGKSAKRVIAQLRAMRARHGSLLFEAVDNILPSGYYKDFLPELAQDPLGDGVEIFYEIKANLTRERARLLAAAGVKQVQPGVESLSTHVLGLMRKGITALQNVFFLKLARTFGLATVWNMLIRFPDETREDYASVVELVPKITHLAPPLSPPADVEIHRFSPFFFERGWTTQLRPREWYRAVYPEDRVDLAEVAYYFGYSLRDTLPDEAFEPVTEVVERWLHRWISPELPRLAWRKGRRGTLRIEDTRGKRPVTLRLPPEESFVHRAIDDPTTARAVASLSGAPPLARVEAILERFVGSGIAIGEGGVFLGLALPASAPEPSFEYRTEHWYYRWVRELELAAPSETLS